MTYCSHRGALFWGQNLDQRYHFRGAVDWVEKYLANPDNAEKNRTVIKRRSSVLKRMQSNLSGSTVPFWGRMSSFFGNESLELSQNDVKSDSIDSDPRAATAWHNLVVFSAGLSLGLLVASRMSLK